MSAFDKPQIISHVQKSLNYTVFDCKWVPCSAKFVTLGNFARGTGVIQLYEIQHGDVKLLREVGVRSARIQDLGLLWCGGSNANPGLDLHSPPHHHPPQKKRCPAYFAKHSWTTRV